MSNISEPNGFDIDWAEDVLDVAKHVHGSYGEKKPGYTPFKKALHEWANGEDARGNPNKDKFLGDWVPKAQKMKLDARKSAGEDQILLREKKSIRELQDLLKQAILGSEEIGFELELEAALKDHA